ncbi:hypothetical protein Agabi119p4_10711 [Agaricus bisporus var. burnettii]|uniref:CCHC-type domain-containing protein n=1 Tax=Agaricus bisporus var. burnettii TaxID=192524 RepID=A0A8H7C2V7_AGABI|nr:hypothetical protein Agabi119p4_10711 [Agaricus bisporus var. burnettii]
MSDEVLERIMGCWTFHKITEVSHFRRETNWPEKWIQACGQSLIDLLISYSPSKEKSTLAPPSTLVLSEPTLVFSDSSTLAHPLTPVLSDPYPFPTPAQPSDYFTAASTGTTKAIEDNARPVLAALPRPRKRAQIRCGNCQQLGHNQRSCKVSKKVKVELLSLTTSEGINANPATSSPGLKSVADAGPREATPQPESSAGLLHVSAMVCLY